MAAEAVAVPQTVGFDRKVDTTLLVARTGIDINEGQFLQALRPWLEDL